MESTALRELRSRIGRAVRKLRTEEGISAQHLAKVLGVTQPTISRIERGSTSIAAEKLCFLARAFNRPLSFFVGEQSPIIHNNEDFLRAGLVQYGARHLKAKRAIDPSTYWRTYADFLNDALTEVHDPRTAAAVAATLYTQALRDKLNKTRILATVQNERLIANLFNLISLIDRAQGKFKDPSKKRKRAITRLNDLKDDIIRTYKPNRTIITVADISPSYVAEFINESLGNE